MARRLGWSAREKASSHTSATRRAAGRWNTHHAEVASMLAALVFSLASRSRNRSSEKAMAGRNHKADPAAQCGGGGRQRSSSAAAASVACACHSALIALWMRLASSGRA